MIVKRSLNGCQRTQNEPIVMLERPYIERISTGAQIYVRNKKKNHHKWTSKQNVINFFGCCVKSLEHTEIDKILLVVP